MLEYFIANKTIPYSQHFKIACMLGPTIDDDNLMDDVTCGEAIMHLLTINWKVVFSIIPPKEMLGGWAAFLVGAVRFCHFRGSEPAAQLNRTGLSLRLNFFVIQNGPFTDQLVS